MTLVTMSLAIFLLAMIVVADCLVDKRSTFPALARRYELNHLTKILLKEIRDLKLHKRVRRFSKTINPIDDERILRRNLMSITPDRSKYDPNYFILENSYVYKSKYDDQDDHLNLINEESTPPIVPAKSSSGSTRTGSRCSRPDFVAGPSGYRFMCPDKRREAPETWQLIESAIPNDFAKTESKQRILSGIRSLFSERNTHLAQD